jgi:hypothetical protein
LPGTDSVVCFDVFVTKPIDTAYAAVLITDNAGNLNVIELRYSPAKFTLTPSVSVISFPNLSIGSDSCITVRLKNIADLSQSVRSVTLDTAGGFKLASIVPALPLQLKPGDSIVMNVCFSPYKNGIVTDTLRINLDCLTLPVPFSGSGGTGLISATDADFGKTDTGARSSSTITISNIGSKPLTLTKNWTISGSKAFSFTPPPLPLIFGSTGTKIVNVQYAPKAVGKDTAIIHWATDIAAPYTDSVKSYSVLTGEGVAGSSSVKKSPSIPVLSIRPNPAGGSSIILTIGTPDAENAEVQIFDLLGREMYKKNILPQANESRIEIPIGSLQNGIYYARVIIGGKTMTEKFEVMR